MAHPTPVDERQSEMSRVVLVSNRVSDLRRAAQAGGVAVALAYVARTRPSLWFGWSGEIRPAEEAALAQQAGRIVTVPLSPTEHERYYLGYANSVLWPVFHNRLDLAQFEAGYFDEYMGVNRRLAALLQAPAARRRRDLGARLPPDPAGGRAARARRRQPHRLLSAHPLPALADVHGHPRAQAARALPGRLRPRRPADQVRRVQSHRLPGQRRHGQRHAGRPHPGVRPPR